MSLKRKASSPALALGPSTPALSEWGIMTDTPKHLHCRTRKRFKNDRPSDEVVYGNTLRWLFSAQQQQGPTPTLDDEAMDSEPTAPTPETVDPRQQTILQFFRPAPQRSSPFRPSPQALVPRAHDIALVQNDTLRHQAFDRMNSVDSFSASETFSSTSNQMDTDVEMGMDVDSSSDGSDKAPKKWVGWM